MIEFLFILSTYSIFNETYPMIFFLTSLLSPTWSLNWLCANRNFHEINWCIQFMLLFLQTLNISVFISWIGPSRLYSAFWLSFVLLVMFFASQIANYWNVLFFKGNFILWFIFWIRTFFLRFFFINKNTYILFVWLLHSSLNRFPWFILFAGDFTVSLSWVVGIFSEKVINKYLWLFLSLSWFDKSLVELVITDITMGTSSIS